jgi:hypothetical protein
MFLVGHPAAIASVQRGRQQEPSSMGDPVYVLVSYLAKFLIRPITTLPKESKYGENCILWEKRQYDGNGCWL